MPLTKEEKQKIIKKFAQVKGDTGSPEIQIALLTQEIKKLVVHLKEHFHDVSAKRGLLSKIAKRRRLLRYLASKEAARYKKIVKELGIKK